jgi:glycerophosphoryl diester phosphodiesterase
MISARTLKIGHRGAAGHEPENTLSAVKKGIALGVDYIEVDVQVTSDRHFVLMHDKFVTRTTGGVGRVVDMSLDELLKLDAGRGEKIPLLREVLEIADNRVGLILESITPGITLDLFREVAAFGFSGPVLFASFHHNDLVRLREFFPDVKSMALIEAVPVKGAEFAIEAGATHVGAALDSMTREFGEMLHKAGFQVFLYTADSHEQISLAKTLGADGIISNFPERI